MLLDLRENIETCHRKSAEDVGLTETEYSFHNILMAEVTKQTGEDVVDESTHQRIIEVIKTLVQMMEEATLIVDFFKKQDEVKRVRKNIKRAILEEDFGSKELIDAISDRFMELARVKFK
jgi:type I restriction enzyme R subunit